jgi:hypothetical protein
MRHYSMFDHEGIQYQVIELPTLNRVQLWLLERGAHRWEVGHGKDIPTDMDFHDVADTMREFILGDMTYSQYNELLPY